MSHWGNSLSIKQFDLVNIDWLEIPKLFRKFIYQIHLYKMKWMSFFLHSSYWIPINSTFWIIASSFLNKVYFSFLVMKYFSQKNLIKAIIFLFLNTMNSHQRPLTQIRYVSSSSRWLTSYKLTYLQENNCISSLSINHHFNDFLLIFYWFYRLNFYYFLMLIDCKSSFYSFFFSISFFKKSLINI